MLQEHVNQNCMEIPHEHFFSFSLAWLLLILAFTKSASLVSRVVNKPNTQLTSDVNDFVNTESHTCKRETRETWEKIRENDY